jgi:hypothetical protein
MRSMIRIKSDHDAKISFWPASGSVVSCQLSGWVVRMVEDRVPSGSASAASRSEASVSVYHADMYRVWICILRSSKTVSRKIEAILWIVVVGQVNCLSRLLSHTRIRMSK